MSKKISIDQIASWRSGELLTEEKLQQVFTLIGEVINLNSVDLEKTVSLVSSINVATRWLTIVDTYSDIKTWVEENKGTGFNPEIPHKGDTIMVNNNSDDPALPVGINPGRYLYIYNYNPITETGSWNLYNPFALVNATTQNDGLMSKEAFIKLNDLPNNTELTQKFDNVELQIGNNTTEIDALKPKVEKNISDITSLKSRVSTTEQNKQDKRTDNDGTPLKGYTSTTVVDNLVEVKELLDNTLKQDILIWEQQRDGEKATTNSILGTTTTISIPFDKLDLTPNTFNKLYFKIEFDKEGLVLPVISLDIASQFINQQDGDKIIMVVYKIPPFVINTTINETPYGVCKYIQDGERYILEFTLLNLPASFNGSNITITPLKIIKDIGVSDYMWGDVVEQEIKDFLNKSLGIKRQLITSNKKPDGFDGFKANDEFTLNLEYVINGNAISIYQGGIKLTQGVEYEEVQTSDPVFSNRIKFLKDINIEKDGALLIEAIALMVNQIQLRIWNANTQYVVGNIVIHEGKIWYCKVSNINQQPFPASTYWEVLQQDINIDKLREDIRNYIDDSSAKIVEDNIAKKQNGAALIYTTNELVDYLDYASFVEVLKELVKLKAYVLNNNTKSLIDTNGNDAQGNPVYERTSQQGNYPVKYLKNIYVDCLANINILTATPEEIGAEIRSQLAKYVNVLTTKYKEEVLVFKDEADFNEFKTRNHFTDNDFDDIASTNDNELVLETPDSLNEVKVLADLDGSITLSSFTGKVYSQVNNSADKSLLAKQSDLDIVSGNVRTNTTAIQGLRNSKVDVNAVYTKSEGDSRYATKMEDTTFENTTTFRLDTPRNKHLFINNLRDEKLLRITSNGFSAVSFTLLGNSSLTFEGQDIYFDNNNTQFLSGADFSGSVITNVGNPTADDHGANKRYVDTEIANAIQNQDLSNYYTKSESDSKYIKLENSTRQTVNSEIYFQNPAVYYPANIQPSWEAEVVVNKRYVDEKLNFNRVVKTLSQAGARWFATRRPGNDIVIYFGYIDNFRSKFGFSSSSQLISITPFNEYSNCQTGIAFSYRESADILYYSITQGYGGDNYNSYSNTIKFMVVSLR